MKCLTHKVNLVGCTLLACRTHTKPQLHTDVEAANSVRLVRQNQFVFLATGFHMEQNNESLTIGLYSGAWGKSPHGSCLHLFSFGAGSETQLDQSGS